jgi:hypothetical protein
MNFEKRFSIPHYDSEASSEREFYTLIKNSSEDYKFEISDVYFGAMFVGNRLRLDQDLRYGNAMGVYISDDKHLDDLFKIQDELNVPISLTLNSIVQPPDLMAENQMLHQFINWLGEYYERGLRRCTLSFVHLMATGVLQKKFPEMIWKSSVFQNVDSPQQFIDFAHCGYNVIQLGRNVNRNTDLLPEFKRLAEKYNVKTSMTVTDNYLPNSPFRPEHDSWHETMEINSNSYRGAWGLLTTDRWTTKDTENLPRLNNNLVWMSEDVLEYYFDHVDIFKYTGRPNNLGPNGYMSEGRSGLVAADSVPMDRSSAGMAPIGISDTPTTKNFKMVWRYPTEVIKKHPSISYDSGVDYYSESFRSDLEPFTYAESFKELYENKLSHYSLWSPVGWVNDQFYNERSWDKIPNTIWDSPEGKVLEHILMTCENQCYVCNACEDTFKVDQIDSLVGLNNPAESIGEAQTKSIKEWDERSYKEKREEEWAEKDRKNLEESLGPYNENIQQTLQWPN